MAKVTEVSGPSNGGITQDGKFIRFDFALPNSSDTLAIKCSPAVLAETVAKLASLASSTNPHFIPPIDNSPRLVERNVVAMDINSFTLAMGPTGPILVLQVGLIPFAFQINTKLLYKLREQIDQTLDQTRH